MTKEELLRFLEPFTGETEIFIKTPSLDPTPIIEPKYFMTSEGEGQIHLHAMHLSPNQLPEEDLCQTCDGLAACEDPACEGPHQSYPDCWWQARKERS